MFPMLLAFVLRQTNICPRDPKALTVISFVEVRLLQCAPIFPIYLVHIKCQLRKIVVVQRQPTNSLPLGIHNSCGVHPQKLLI